MPSRALLAGLAGIGLEAGEDGVADLALEGPQRLFAGLSLGHFLVVVGAVFYLPDPAAREQMQARLAAAGAHPVPQIGYWQANGDVTYQDPDGREVVFASWIYIPPGS